MEEKACKSIGTIKCLLCDGDRIYPGPSYKNHLIHEHGVTHNVEYLIKLSIHKRDHKDQLPDFIEEPSQKCSNKEEKSRQIRRQPKQVQFFFFRFSGN